ncbi:hypothetical protein HY490_01260 [Candidatus Woesearchaeota archaeon]|nr:hypothetical protein [Candidatus Woesearchaeota archaeon]
MRVLVMGNEQYVQDLLFHLRHAKIVCVRDESAECDAVVGSDVEKVLSVPASLYFLIAPHADGRTLALLDDVSQPVVFLHGTADAVNPPSHTEALSFHAKHKTVFWIAGADHDFSHPYHRYQLIHHIIHYLSDPMCSKG